MGINFIIAVIIFAPLLGCLLTGFFSKHIRKMGINYITTGLVGLSFLLSIIISYSVYNDDKVYNINFFSWIILGDFRITVNFLLDRLSIFMVVIVTFISTLVHIYSIGYMFNEKGYARFFTYISGFTFAMLCLVASNNFILLFFGWELVGLFSYLLIGYYFENNPANEASFRAFIINRICDLGLLIGISAIFFYCQSFDYNDVFQSISYLRNKDISFLGLDTTPVTLFGVFLFIGAMGKSAQVPFHTWLEGSMEGPTPISALIHAATMVTAGVFLIARLSPIFIASTTVLSLIMIVGSITCLFMGLVAIVQNDIKRIIAYCTLSQLGYMMVAQGSTGFSIGIFHLMTHAMFKALLFLGAGCVIIFLKHEQDIRNMGGLRKSMPITYISMVIGALSLSAIPPFSGFFSKDLIIEAAKLTTIPGHMIAYYATSISTFITSFYIFRMIFLVFHNSKESITRTCQHSSISMTMVIPLIILCIPSIFIGMVFFHLVLTPDFLIDNKSYIQTGLGNKNLVFFISTEIYNRTFLNFIFHSFYTWQFWLSISAIFFAYLLYVIRPSFLKIFCKTYMFKLLYHVLVRKYFIDYFYNVILVNIFIFISKKIWLVVDMILIDRILISGMARTVSFIGRVMSKTQRGYLFDYSLISFASFLILLIWFVFFN